MGTRNNRRRTDKRRKLTALLMVYDVELASLNFEIDSPWIDFASLRSAVRRRDDVLVAWGKTITALNDLGDHDDRGEIYRT